MRFNSQAYDKVFPRQTEVHEQVETAVETFRPSEEPEQEVVEPEKTVEPPQPIVEEPSIEERGGEIGTGNDGELNNEQ